LARPITPSRSNYFKLYTIQALWHNNALDDELRDHYGHEQMASFIEYLFSISKVKRLGLTTNKVRQLLNNKDFQGISDYIDNDESNRIELMGALLFDYATQLKFPEIDNIVFNYVLSSPSTIYEEDPEYLNHLQSMITEISKETHDQLLRLINGYKEYLNRLNTNNESKTQICLNIEKETFKNKIVNIRQDYHFYDEFFNNFTSKYKNNPEFSINSRVAILLNTLDYIPVKP